ncbi:MAG TPA: NUDIX hydrolase [Rhodobacteraceae bacterium]|nr:NUDIX hydrolase [Paracoccaceae bacterium]
MTDIVNGLLLRDQQVLMAHRSVQRKNYPGTWSFPGGHVEVGETLAQALRRELSEEIGVLATSWTFLRRFTAPDATPGRPVVFHFFAVEAWDGEPTNLGNEHSEIRWVAVADAPRMQDLTFGRYVELFEDLASS